MAARKRATLAAAKPPTTTTEPHSEEKTDAANSTAVPPIALCKAVRILSVALIFPVLHFYLMFFHYDNFDTDIKRGSLNNALFSIAGAALVGTMIPVASTYLLRRNLYGHDINKKGTPQGSVKVPETLGIVVGVVYLVSAILFQFFNFTSNSIWLAACNAALASICLMILLGFVDDVLDIPWRVKLFLPAIAALPLLMAYNGHTTIVIPKPLVLYLGLEVLDLGWIYILYMWLLVIFCTNSINIHAGINGLEVGQTVVISCAILIHNVIQIGVSSDLKYKQAHALSIFLIQPLLATSLPLLYFNWYPSSVFVGDTYTYFAGMTMAVAGILGHFSETLLIFFLPQVLNFLLSVPQLFGFIPCPRHRLPRFDPQTGLLTGTNDGTLVNLFLRLFGPLSEKSLCILLLVFQAICCCFGFMLRWHLAGWYK